MEGAAKSVSSEDVEPNDLGRVVDRTRERMKRGGAVKGSVRPVPVVAVSNSRRAIQEVALVPDQDPVQ
jgi:hypothetical protein